MFILRKLFCSFLNIKKSNKESKNMDQKNKFSISQSDAKNNHNDHGDNLVLCEMNQNGGIKKIINEEKSSGNTKPNPVPCLLYVTIEERRKDCLLNNYEPPSYKEACKI